MTEFEECVLNVLRDTDIRALKILENCDELAITIKINKNSKDRVSVSYNFSDYIKDGAEEGIDAMYKFVQTYSGVLDPKVPIEALDLSIRSYNSLARIGIRKIADIQERLKVDMYDENSLRNVRNLGIKSFTELLSALYIRIKTT